MLEDLQGTREAEHVVLGGGFALQHYLSFRPTYDIDARYSQSATPTDRGETVDRLREIAQAVARNHGLAYRERARAASDVVSLELLQGSSKTFSFQIATRTIELDTPLSAASPWSPVQFESLRDNIASKMTALVTRGAPRDFQDVYAVTTKGLVTIDEAWAMWSTKNPTLDLDAAKAQVIKRMESIELRRPIETVPLELQDSVAESRRWVREDFANPSFGLERLERDATTEFDRKPEVELDDGPER